MHKEAYIARASRALAVLATVSLSIVSMARPAHATESFDGHRFISLCLVAGSDHESERRFAECERFVGEVRQLLGYHTVHGFRACIPESVPDIELLIAGIARIQAVSEQHDREAHAILAELYAQRWPCSG